MLNLLRSCGSLKENQRDICTPVCRRGRQNHALYRGVVGKASCPFGIVEMQPGVLNWNPYRVSPMDGMVRL